MSTHTPRMTADYRRLHEDLLAAGFVYAGKDGATHHCYRHPTATPVRMPSTPQRGRARSFTNTRARVRRAITEATCPK